MKRIKVLYIDDEEINLDLFVINLIDKYEVFTALCGTDGLKILVENMDIDVVVTDMNMPEMTGIEFIHKARNLFPSLSFFILTGYGITAQIKNALDTGLIHNYFKKPFDMMHICSEIDSALKP